MEEARLIRFVAAPDGTVTPDLGRKLPGRGMWVEATRASVDQAARKGGFSRSAKAKLTASSDLADQVETLLVRQCLDRLGLARRAGALTSGFEKVSALVSSGKAAWLIEAADGSADGRGKILALARKSPKPPQDLRCVRRGRIEFGLGPWTCDTHGLPRGTMGGALV